jgi:hypothetical protein
MPWDRGRGWGKRIEVKEKELKPDSIESLPHFGGPFSFGIASVEASMTHRLHAFGWDVLHHERDEVESREGDITPQAGSYFLI